MRLPIRIATHYPEILKIFYLVTTACPYNCRYCPEHLHNGKNEEIDLVELETFFQRFADREILLNLTGGEATQHPQFKDIVQLARSLGIRVSVDTNCVRTVRFYNEVASLVDAWNITLHPSQHTIDLEKIRTLTDASFVVVYVMMDPLHWGKSIDWIEQLKPIPDIKIIPLQAINNWGGADHHETYTTEQTEYMLANPSIMTFTQERFAELKQTHSYLLKTDSTVHYNDGSAEIVDPYMMVKTAQHNFNGWKCLAGNQTMNISYDGSVLWANCGIKRYKHFSDVNPDDLKLPVICDRNECGCSADIRASKSKD